MLYFLIFFFAEIFITIEVGGYLGGFLSIIEIIISFFIGVMLLKFLKLNFIEGIMDLAKRDIDKKNFVIRNILSLVGCLFLMLPGFLSDFIGLLFQFSMMENVILRFMGKSKLNRNDDDYYKDSNIIDVEIDIKTDDDDKKIGH